MKKFNLGNGNEIVVEKANRGLEDDYKITFYENGRNLMTEYGNREYIEYEYEVKF